MADKTTERRLALLEQVPLFANLRQRELERILNDLRLREYQRDDIIFRQGDESREVYLVLSGKIRIFKISPSGNETSITIFSTNDIIGEQAAIDNRPRNASAKAIGAVALLVMSQDHFIHHLENIPGLALNLARQLSQKLDWTAAFAESIAQFDAAGRLLHILLDYSERYGRTDDEGRLTVNLALNQTDLASMVGARREWINRLLSDWRRRGLLEYERGKITVLDMDRVIAERDSRIEANAGEANW